MKALYSGVASLKYGGAGRYIIEMPNLGATEMDLNGNEVFNFGSILFFLKHLSLP